MTEIKHDLDVCFYAVQGSDKAVLEYSRERSVLNILRVFVPPAFRGQGLAAKLTQQAFEFAEMKNYQVIPTCPYVCETFLARYPQYQKNVL